MLVNGYTRANTEVHIDDTERRRIAIETIQYATGISDNHFIQGRRLKAKHLVPDNDRMWKETIVDIRPATTQDEAAILVIDAIRNCL